MIKYNKIISSIANGTTMCSKVITQGVVVWQKIKSCFGSGSWKQNNKWINNDFWK